MTNKNGIFVVPLQCLLKEYMGRWAIGYWRWAIGDGQWAMGRIGDGLLAMGDGANRRWAIGNRQ